MDTSNDNAIQEREAEITELLNYLERCEESLVKALDRLKEKVRPVVNYGPRPEEGMVGQDSPERMTEIGSILQLRINNICHVRDELVDLTERVEL